ncbi:hypothetical protein GCM10022198_00410 [Klugiella xanthotipulae]|uniref:C2H2-type domain-containing protein n=1 Tax=Klugiella xanthotipulae TaxID=244735 RepID=A0A543I5U3_9MICO|nr:hypothetical protein [Klugiella xanthotipulae]TQM65820.1 hypothetical protein FB466_0633 [Klugiella xanthotipulae]
MTANDWGNMIATAAIPLIVGLALVLMFLGRSKPRPPRLPASENAYTYPSPADGTHYRWSCPRCGATAYDQNIESLRTHAVTHAATHPPTNTPKDT